MTNDEHPVATEPVVAPPVKRTRKPKTPVDAATDAEVPPEVAAAPAKRGRKPKAAVEAPAETPTDAVAPAKRGRKPKAPVEAPAEATAETPSGEEAPTVPAAPTKRGRKPKATAEATAETPSGEEAPTVVAAPAKRGRKPKAPVEATPVETAAVEATETETVAAETPAAASAPVVAAPPATVSPGIRSSHRHYPEENSLYRKFDEELDRVKNKAIIFHVGEMIQGILEHAKSGMTQYTYTIKTPEKVRQPMKNIHTEPGKPLTDQDIFNAISKEALYNIIHREIIEDVQDIITQVFTPVATEGDTDQARRSSYFETIREEHADHTKYIVNIRLPTRGATTTAAPAAADARA